MNIQDPAVRRYIYGIVVAAIPLLVILGVIAQNDAQVWLNLAAAALGLGTATLALPNTPKDAAPVAPPEGSTAQHRAGA